MEIRSKILTVSLASLSLLSPTTSVLASNSVDPLLSKYITPESQSKLTPAEREFYKETVNFIESQQDAQLWSYPNQAKINPVTEDDYREKSLEFSKTAEYASITKDLPTEGVGYYLVSVKDTNDLTESEISKVVPFKNFEIDKTREIVLENPNKGFLYIKVNSGEIVKVDFQITGDDSEDYGVNISKSGLWDSRIHKSSPMYPQGVSLLEEQSSNAEEELSKQVESFAKDIEREERIGFNRNFDLNIQLVEKDKDNVKLIFKPKTADYTNFVVLADLGISEYSNYQVHGSNTNPLSGFHTLLDEYKGKSPGRFMIAHASHNGESIVELIIDKKFVKDGKLTFNVVAFPLTQAPENLKEELKKNHTLPWTRNNMITNNPFEVSLKVGEQAKISEFSPVNSENSKYAKISPVKDGIDFKFDWRVFWLSFGTIMTVGIVGLLAYLNKISERK